MKKKLIIVVAILLGLVALRAILYMVDGFKTGQKMKQANIPGVTIGVIEEKNVIKKFEAPARVLSPSRISIVARVNGYLVKSYFKEGDMVKKGAVLFEIEPKEWQLAVNKAKAQLDNATAQLTYYEKQLERSSELVKQDYISKSQYDQALSNRDSYRAQVALAKSNYQDALRNLSYTKIKAPVDGQVGMINISVGNYVTPSTGELTTINSIDPMYVTFPIDAKGFTELVRVDKTAYVNREVDLYFSNGVKYDIQGIQNFHDNKVDETTGTITMRATFANPKGVLISGNYATVYLYSKEREGVPVVPLTATMENPSSKYVYIIDEKGLPQVRNIETFGQEGDDWIVKSGLKKGDRVVFSGLQGVIPGNPVRELSAEEIQQRTQEANAGAEKKEEEQHKKGTN